MKLFLIACNAPHRTDRHVSLRVPQPSDARTGPEKRDFKNATGHGAKLVPIPVVPFRVTPASAHH